MFLKIREGKGQALVEFALILLVLLFLIFVIIESARIFQANLTVQAAARQAGRYATTGQFEADCLLDSPPCADPRVHSIKAVAEQALAGLPLDPNAVYEEEGYYLIEVFGTDEEGNLISDFAGVAGGPIWVRITYQVGMVTPLVRPIAETVRVFGQVLMNNELFNQVENVEGPNNPPVPPVLPTLGPSPTPAPIDLILDKVDEFDPVVEGEEFDYYFTVQNTGDFDAGSAQVVDTLPGGFTYVGGSPGCTPSGGTVTCDLGTVPAHGGASFFITVQAPATVAVTTTVTNTATVSYSGTDANPINNTDTEETTLIPTPNETDLSIVKFGPLEAPTDLPLKYTVIVSNVGLIPAEFITVTDILPPGTTYDDSASSIDCDLNAGGDVECTAGSLARGAALEFSIVVNAPTTAGQLDNFVCVDSLTIDDNAGNDCDTWTTNVVEAADLEVVKFDEPDPALPDEPLTYTLVVHNYGPKTANNVTLEDSLPFGVDLVSTAATQGSCAESGNVVNCNLGSILMGQTVTVTLVTNPFQQATIINSVSVSADELDLDEFNNFYAVATSVKGKADMAVTKTATPAVLDAGELLTYTITVVNNGPSPATSVLLNDFLPSTVAFQSASTTKGVCTQLDSTLIACNIGTMAEGETVVITVIGIPTQGGASPGQTIEITNFAEVFADQSDTETDNNSAQVTNEVGRGDEYILVNPTCGDPGTEFTVQGQYWGKDKVVSLYLNNTSNLIGQVTAFGSDGLFSFVYTDSVNLPYGNYTIIAQEGTNQDTATFRIPCPAPDLVVDSLTLLGTQPVTEGLPVTFTAQIRNIGEEPAINQFFVGLYFDPTPAPVTDTTHIDESFRQTLVAISGLPEVPKAGSVVSVTLTASNGFSVTGSVSQTVPVYAVVDSDPEPKGRIKELYEDNNISAALDVVVEQGTVQEPPTTTQKTGIIIGQAYVLAAGGQLLPQAGVEVSIYDITGTAPFARTFTDNQGFYDFQNLAEGPYVLKACITIDGNEYFFEVTVNSVNLNPPPPTEQDLFLEQGFCS